MTPLTLLIFLVTITFGAIASSFGASLDTAIIVGGVCGTLTLVSFTVE